MSVHRKPSKGHYMACGLPFEKQRDAKKHCKHIGVKPDEKHLYPNEFEAKQTAAVLIPEVERLANQMIGYMSARDKEIEELEDDLDTITAEDEDDFLGGIVDVRERRAAIKERIFEGKGFSAAQRLVLKRLYELKRMCEG